MPTRLLHIGEAYAFVQNVSAIYVDESELSESERGKQHAFVITRTLRASAQKEKMQVCANLLSVLDTLVMDKDPENVFATEEFSNANERQKRKIEEAAKRAQEQRFGILRSLAQAHEFAFRTILEAVIRQASEVVKDEEVMKMQQLPKDLEKQRTKYVSARKVQVLVKRFDRRLKQGLEADWKIDKFRMQRVKEKKTIEDKKAAEAASAVAGVLTGQEPSQ